MYGNQQQVRGERGGERHDAVRRFGLVLLLLSSLVLPSRAEAEQDRIALLQAAFLYRFVSFVDWPVREPEEPSQDFGVGVLGRDPFGATLDEVFAEPDGDGHAFALVRSSDPDSLLHCRIVFVAIEEPKLLDAALTALRARPILLVGHQPDFALRGGHLNFVVDAERLRFEVNLDAVQASGLRMSSRLLALARIVHAPEH